MRREERILLWGSNLWLLGDGLLGPLFAVFAGEIGGDIFDITAAWAIFMIVTGILTIQVGKFGDKIGHEYLLFAGYALNTVFTFSFLLIETPAQLFMVQAGLGISLALANPTWYALYDKYSTPNKDGYIWGVASGHGNIATGIAAMAGGYIVTNYSFEVLFITMGIIQAITTILQAQLFFRKKTRVVAKRKRPRKIKKNG